MNKYNFHLVIIIVSLFIVGILFPMRSIGKALYKEATENDSIIISDSLVLYYLDGHVIRHDRAMKMLMEDTIVGYADRDPRTAIKLYGEKGRNGVILFEYKRK